MSFVNNSSQNMKRKFSELKQELSSEVKMKKAKVHHLQCASLEELDDFLTHRVIDVKGVCIKLAECKHKSFKDHLFYWTCNKCNGRGCEHDGNHQAYHLRIRISDQKESNFFIECTLFGAMAAKFIGKSPEELASMARFHTCIPLERTNYRLQDDDAIMSVIEEKERLLYDVSLKEKTTDPTRVYVQQIIARNEGN